MAVESQVISSVAVGVENRSVFSLPSRDRVVATAAKLANNPWVKFFGMVGIAAVLNSFEQVNHAAAQTQNPYDQCFVDGVKCAVGPDGYSVEKDEGVVLNLLSMSKSFGWSCSDPEIMNLSGIEPSHAVFPITPTGEVEVCGQGFEQGNFSAALDQAVKASIDSKESLNKFDNFLYSTKAFVIFMSGIVVYTLSSIAFMAKYGKRMGKEISHPFSLFPDNDDDPE
jgi:hypothetical protein